MVRFHGMPCELAMQLTIELTNLTLPMLPTTH